MDLNLDFTTSPGSARRRLGRVGLGGLLLAVLAGGAAPAVAEVWRLVDPQGRVTFTDRVSDEELRSGRATPVAVPGTTPEQEAQAQMRRQQAAREIADEDRLRTRRQGLHEQAARATEAAQQRLLEAQARAADETPQPGEVSRTRFGARLNERYEQRREQDRLRVDEAERSLERARAAEAALPP